MWGILTTIISLILFIFLFKESHPSTIFRLLGSLILFLPGYFALSSFPKAQRIMFGIPLGMAVFSLFLYLETVMIGWKISAATIFLAFLGSCLLVLLVGGRRSNYYRSFYQDILNFCLRHGVKAERKIGRDIKQKPRNNCISAFFFILTLLLLAGVYLRIYPEMKGNLNLDFPVLQKNWDVMYNQIWADALIHTRDAKHWASYLVAGNEGMYNTHFMIFLLLVSSITLFSGASVFQVYLLLSALVSVWLVCCVAVIAKRFFGNSAGIFTMLSLFPLHWKWNFSWRNGWGQEIFNYILMVVILVLIHQYFKEKRTSYLLYSTLLVITIFLSHLIEMLYLSIFGLFIMVKLVKAIGLRKTATYSITGLLIALPFIWYHYPLTTLSTGKDYGKLITGFPRAMSDPIVPFGFLPWYIYPLAIAGIWVLWKKERVLFFFFVSIFFFGFGNFLFGFDPGRANRILLSTMPMIFFLLSGLFSFVKRWNAITTALILLFLIPILPESYAIMQEEIIADKYIDEPKWQALLWLRENTNKDDLIYFFNVALIHNTETFSHRISAVANALHPETNKTLLEVCINKTIPDKFFSSIHLDHPPILGLIKDRSLFDFSFVDPFEKLSKEKNFSFSKISELPLSAFDYIITHHNLHVEQECNRFFINQLNQSRRVVYRNSKITILH